MAGANRTKGRQMDVNAAQTEGIKESLPPMLSVEQSKDVLNVSGRTIARMCEQGKLKAVKVCSLWRINRDALFEYAGLD